MLLQQHLKRTLDLFGSVNGNNTKKAFHLYSMKQAIEEKFILNVLQNYTSYKTYFRIAKAIQDDPELNKNKAKAAVARFAELHPENIAQKTIIILDHFCKKVQHKIGGSARAMVVCASRKAVVKYAHAFKKELKERGEIDNINIIAAFTDKVKLKGEEYAESDLNEFGSNQITSKFKENPYRLLIAADKFQTGFDEPLLHTMYVDKPLSGVNAVQTLSRLNRIYPGKEDTFVLDFVNNREEILEAFEPFYKETHTDEELEYNIIYDIRSRLDDFGVYERKTIEQFAEIFFNPKNELAEKNVIRKLYGLTDTSLNCFMNLSEQDQKKFRLLLGKWLDSYTLIAQIAPFTDVFCEKFYCYGKYLLRRLPKQTNGESMDLDNDLILEYIKIDKTADGSLVLKEEETPLKNTMPSIKEKEKEKDYLSEIIERVNERFGTDFNEKDKLIIKDIENKIISDQKLLHKAKVNDKGTFKHVFNSHFDDLFADNFERNKKLYEKVISNDELNNELKQHYINALYRENTRLSNKKTKTEVF